MNVQALRRLQKAVELVYGEDASQLFQQIQSLLQAEPKGTGKNSFTERDALLITYGDIFRPSDSLSEKISGVVVGPGSALEPGTGPSTSAGPDTGLGTGTGGSTFSNGALPVLTAFLRRWNRHFTYVHLLPFHPYSSDDGFSVIDYGSVDRRIGTWEDIAELGKHLNVAFDLVINHGSAQSPMFKAFLRNEEPYAHWFLTRPKDYDSSTVVRPRTHPLLTPFVRNDGSTVYVWTTFSADQVDYDFSKTDVLIAFIRIFLDFIHRGAKIIRLDAIAYLWKEDGTPCLHHPKTHGVVKILRAIIDALELDVTILTETNVPHRENISYYGQGDEAHMVYNFALPPLVLHAAVSGDAEPLGRWASSLPPPGEGPIFLNFLASHDGVGLTPAMDLIDPAAFSASIEKAQRRGALVSYKATAQGSIPYELNCSYLSVAAPPELGSPELRSRLFLTTQAVLLALAGLPAVYIHSWIGSEQWAEGPVLLGYNRAINREKPPVDRVERELEEKGSLRSLIYDGFFRLQEFRSREGAFSALAGQVVVPSTGSLFALLRGPDPTGRRVLCLFNFGSQPAQLEIPPLVGGRLEGTIERLAPYQSRWIAYGGFRDTEYLEI